MVMLITALMLAGLSGASGGIQSPKAVQGQQSGQALLLHDNGPLVNCAGCGAGGADASILQNESLNMNIYGFGHGAGTGDRIADDFVISDTEGWTIDSITFYAQQTNIPADPSPIVAVNYRIWDGPPDEVSSIVIFGDTTTDRLISSGWSGIYRVNETLTDTTNRPILADVVAAGVYLPPGTYWLDWQSDSEPDGEPTAAPITINGQTITGNALQFLGSSNNWTAAVDSHPGNPQQGFPFLIYGFVGHPDDLGIQLTKSVGLDEDICATTNTLAVDAGTAVYYCYKATNTGTVSLTVHDLVDDQFGTIIDDLALELEPGESVDTVQLDLTISRTISAAITNTATWTGWVGSFAISDTHTATVTLLHPEIDVAPPGLASQQAANTIVTQSVTITNAGNGTLSWLVSEGMPGTPPVQSATSSASTCAASGDPPWLSLAPTGGTVPPGSADSIEATFDSAALDAAVYTATVCIESNDPDESLVTVPVTLTVEAALVPSIDLTKTVGTTSGVCATTNSISVEAGTEVIYCYSVRNTGGVTLTRHDLLDSALGPIWNGFHDDLPPAASIQIMRAATLYTNTVNLATWTAYNLGPIDVISATDVATVTVSALPPTPVPTPSSTPPAPTPTPTPLPEPSITLLLTLSRDGSCSTSSGPLTVPWGSEVTYCYTATNDGDVAFSSHTLTDTVGNDISVLLDDFDLLLPAGDSYSHLRTETVAPPKAASITHCAIWEADDGETTSSVSNQACATIEVLAPPQNEARVLLPIVVLR